MKAGRRPRKSPPADEADPRIAALAKEMSGDWAQIVSLWEEFRLKHGYFLRADLEADQTEFLRQAIWAALGKGQLPALVNRFMERGVASDDLPKAAVALLGAEIAPQAYVNGRWRPQDAFLGCRGLTEACAHVCRISIDGSHRGSGVLIRPTIVATAAHVIASLVGPNGKPVADSLRRLSILFFDADGLLSGSELREPEPVPASLDEQWLGYYSPSAPGESEGLRSIDSIDGITSDAGPWDLALLRLARQPRSNLKGHDLLHSDPPEVKFGIHVVHHPADVLGAAMGPIWSIGEMTEGLGSPRPLRWLHDANTDKGSSGAPCFDSSWRIVGLHQAGPAALTAADQNNRAVPIYPWAGKVEGLAATIDPTPYLRQVRGPGGTATPVFGRRDLQWNAWRAMSAARPEGQRVFIVLGDVGTGKTFSSIILSDLAKLAGCSFASLDVRTSQEDGALEFAQRIVGAFGASRPSAPDSAGLTTGLRDIRTDIVPPLVQELEIIAGERPLWLVFDGLEICDTAANGIGLVIEGLVDAIDSAPHLNLALIGWKGPVRAAHSEIVSANPSVDDVIDYLLLELAPPGFVAEPEFHKVLSALVQAKLIERPGEAPFARAAAAAAAATDTVRELLTAYTRTESTEETVP